MSADKRSVATDALQTLGMVNIGESAGRDAIHLAVEPVVAGEKLWPGTNIGIVDGKAYGMQAKKHLGIVDPFLKEPVEAGERFWLIVYPRTITSLRHVWSHPDFGEEISPEQKAIAKEVTERLTNTGVWKAKNWIKEFAENDLCMSVEDLMRAADKWVESGDYTFDNDEHYKDHWGKFPEFWDHYETLTGRRPAERESFFTCSC